MTAVSERAECGTPRGAPRRPALSAADRRGNAAAARAFIIDGTGGANHVSRLYPSDRTGDTAQITCELPCRRDDPELWFADAPADVEKAKALCGGCPIRLACLTVAIYRAEPAGVWGGQLFDQGRIAPFKRPRGRPRRTDVRAVTLADDVLAGGRQMIGVPATPSARTSHDCMDSAAADLYDAERRLHAAHLSRLDGAVTAADKELHDAVAAYRRAAIDWPADCGGQQKGDRAS